MTNEKHDVKQAIRRFIDSVDEAKIEKYHNDALKSAYRDFIDDFFKKVKATLKDEVELRKYIDPIKKEKKKNGQSDLVFLNLKYQKIIAVIKSSSVLGAFISSVNQFDLEINSLKKRNRYEKWIDWALKNGKGIYLATHIAKLTHSSSKSSSIDYRYFERNHEIRPDYLTSVIDKNLTIDWAYPDNALSSIAAFYNINVNGFFVGDLLRKDAFTFLLGITKSKEKALLWSEIFQLNIREDIKKSHFLSKQVFFPLGEKGYHLLMPLVSSSMAHALHLKFKMFFDDENKLIRDQKKNKKYHSKLVVSYPNRAILNVTRSNHSNASSLNGKRGGRLTILSAMPPQWTGKQQLPTHQRNLFNKSLGYKLQEGINDLQRLLLVIKAKEIGMKKPAMHRAIVKAINAIANDLFDEINKINLLSDAKGWSANSDFPLHQQLLLEPGREDEAALEEKNNKQWQEKVAKDFSAWLNKQLHHKNLNLTPVQQRFWKDIFTEQLREFIAFQEVAS